MFSNNITVTVNKLDSFTSRLNRARINYLVLHRRSNVKVDIRVPVVKAELAETIWKELSKENPRHPNHAANRT